MREQGWYPRTFLFVGTSKKAGEYVQIGASRVRKTRNEEDPNAIRFLGATDCQPTWRMCVPGKQDMVSATPRLDGVAKSVDEHAVFHPILSTRPLCAGVTKRSWRAFGGMRTRMWVLSRELLDAETRLITPKLRRIAHSIFNERVHDMATIVSRSVEKRRWRESEHNRA